MMSRACHMSPKAFGKQDNDNENGKDNDTDNDAP